MNKDLEDLERILRENRDLSTSKSDETKSLLASLASYRITRKEHKILVSYDPDKAVSLLELLDTKMSTLDKIETINSLLKLASLTKNVDPEYSSLLSSIVEALMRNDYQTASRLYTKAYSRMGEVLSKLLKEGYITEDELKEILKNT